MPALSRVLAEMSGNLAVAEPNRTDRPDWHDLSDAELDELVDQLVRWGDAMEASELLIRRRGCTATEAHKLLKEKATRVSYGTQCSNS